MSGDIAIIRDEGGRGVRADRIDGWEPSSFGTRVSLAGGGAIHLRIPTPEFLDRLDRALSALRGDR